jgi:hypothetical protein
MPFPREFGHESQACRSPIGRVEVALDTGAVAGDSLEFVTEGEHIDYEWDWLGNQVGWDDDASSFYERSIGAISNGRTEGGGARPSASVAGIESGWDGAGWVEVEYGAGGNVSSFTVHGACADTTTDSAAYRAIERIEKQRTAELQRWH